MADHKIRSFVYGQMSQCFLSIVGNIFPFNAPVEIDNDKLSSGFFERRNIFFYLLFLLQVLSQFINAGKPDFNPVNIKKRHMFKTKVRLLSP